MSIWCEWYNVVKQLRPAFSRTRSFLWFTVSLIGLSIREDLNGVTSIVRALGLKNVYYDRLLDFFHTKAVDIDTLSASWCKIVLSIFPLVKFNGKCVFTADGIKVAKSGKLMPSVKLLHQQSASNTKPEYIMGHSFQAIGVLCGIGKSVFSVPLTSRIHEGVRHSPKDKSTLFDKMVGLLHSITVERPGYFVADAYYANKNIILPLVAMGWDIISRVRFNAVAYMLPVEDKPKGRGRKKVYGDKIKLRDLLLQRKDEVKEIQSPVYGERDVVIKYLCADLLWRPIGKLVRFVIVIHPTRGTIYLMGTDLTMSAIDIIATYGLRFKIEVSFKHILRIIGGYAYHFWMMTMKPTLKKSGDTYLHRETEEYREKVKRKINAYHLYVQTSIIAQGMMMYLSLTCQTLVWQNFGSWMRTMNIDNPPSEFVTSHALRNTMPEFLHTWDNNSTLKKFILEKIDFSLKEKHYWAA